jgi:hypothetical protein
MACRCKQCYGFAEYLEQHGMSTRGLPQATGHPTYSETRAICSGSYGCHCVECQLAARRFVKKRVRQPWEVA